MRELLAELRSYGADLVSCVAFLVIACLLVEGVVRLTQGNALPIVPFVTDAYGGGRGPPNTDVVVKLATCWRRLSTACSAHARYTTDELGARVDGVAARSADRSGGVLVVGDSQMLGWGLRFEQTAAAMLARAIGVPQDRVAILAAASEDPEREIVWAEAYVHRHPEPQRIEVVAINLGNDLDEVYMNRAVARRPASLPTWLTRTSMAFVDLELLAQWIFNPDDPPDRHPDINYSMLYLDDDKQRTILAGGVVAASEQLMRALPPSDKRLFVIIPQDSQVSMREFDKHRMYYADDFSFAKHKQAEALAAQRLNVVQQDISQQLARDRYRVVVLLPALVAAYDKQPLFDTHTDNLITGGQAVEAGALVGALGADR